MGKLKLPKGLYFYDGKGYVINKVIVKGSKPFYKRLGLITEQEAINQFSLIVSSHLKGEYVSKEASSLTVYDVLAHYYDAHLKYLPSGKDARFHIPTLDRFLGQQKVLSLTKSDIETFIRLRSKEVNKRGELVSDRTIQAALQFLNMAVNRAMDDQLLPKNPISRFCKYEVTPKDKVVLDDGKDLGEEWIKLYINIPKIWKKFFLTLYETGMRPSEAVKLRIEWFEKVDDNYIINYPCYAEKTKKFKRIPVSNRLQKRIEHMLVGQGLLFDLRTYERPFNKALAECDFNKRITTYTLRKTRITIWDGIDETASRYATGHQFEDSHRKCYSEVTNQRLFKLVGIELETKHKLKLFKVA